MNTTPLPAPAPPYDDGNETFWSATAEGRLLLPRCNRCSSFIWYPRTWCPTCHVDDATWVQATGRGFVYSFTIVRKGAGKFSPASPYVFAYVELEEGPRVMTNVVDCDPETVTIGMPVEVVFHDTGEGSALYRFRPIS